MDIKAIRMFDGGFMNQPFAFGGEEGRDAFDEQIIYRSSLQNFLIDTGDEVILVDTGFKADFKAPAKKFGAPLYMGDKVADFMEAFAALGYKPEQVTKILITHKHPDHSDCIGEFPNAMQVADGLWFIEAKGHTHGNSIAILEHDGLYYMFHGDVTYCDAALKANKLSIVFEDVAAARETLDRVREFIKQNPTVYLSTHCPEGYENLEMKRVMKL